MILLCIDDDPDDLDLFREAVKVVNRAHQCRVAQSGSRGIEMLATEKPDVIFLDINMPVPSGWDLVKLIRANRDFDDVPVYMLSTTRNAQELEMYARIGATKCLIKPCTFHELCELIKEIIKT